MPDNTEEMEGLVREVAEAAFGFDDLRPGQQDAAAAVLTGRDVLAVMPTGSGKSAIYQLAGALIDGTTVVVSPLIALQHDQVEAIKGRLGGAVQVNSALGAKRRREVFADLEQGKVEFVFVAPEQLANEETFERIRVARPTLFVVDEAHCISTWGHDFRPEYLRLGALVDGLGHPQVLALTATAAPPVRAEIAAQLRMRDPAVVVSGFDRPNICLEVQGERDQTAADGALVERAASLEGTGIVYVATRRRAEELAEKLRSAGRPASPYHAGMTAAERGAVHERFLQPRPCVVVATTAFGMGIDVPHVRFVLHAEPPESIDAYYQEFGRAGRDGEPATAVAFRAIEGGGARRFFSGAAETDGELLVAVAEAVAASMEPIALSDLAHVLEKPTSQLRRAVDLLAGVGAVWLADDQVARTGEMAPADAAAAAAERSDAYRAVERSRREMMDRYLDTDGCRWRFVLGYFGQPTDEGCGHCDNCAGGRRSGADERTREFALDSRVVHESWGDGQVVGYDRDTMTVLFDQGGYKTLSVDLVAEKGLLRLAGAAESAFPTIVE